MDPVNLFWAFPCSCLIKTEREGFKKTMQSFPGEKAYPQFPALWPSISLTNHQVKWSYSNRHQTKWKAKEQRIGSFFSFLLDHVLSVAHSFILFPYLFQKQEKKKPVNQYLDFEDWKWQIFESTFSKLMLWIWGCLDAPPTPHLHIKKTFQYLPPIKS